MEKEVMKYCNINLLAVYQLKYNIYSCISNIDNISVYTISLHILTTQGAVVVVIAWKLDLQLPMQSAPITTNVVSSNPYHTNE